MSTYGIFLSSTDSPPQELNAPSRRRAAKRPGLPDAFTTPPLSPLGSATPLSSGGGSSAKKVRFVYCIVTSMIILARCELLIISAPSAVILASHEVHIVSDSQFQCHHCSYVCQMTYPS